MIAEHVKIVGTSLTEQRRAGQRWRVSDTPSTDISELSRKVEYLTAVDIQNETISQLTAQLRFVLSFLDILA